MFWSQIAALGSYGYDAVEREGLRMGGVATGARLFVSVASGGR